jgi:hypothetical protein
LQIDVVLNEKEKDAITLRFKASLAAGEYEIK